MLPLPPLAEQQRIVDVLDAKLAAVERARAAVQAQIESARQLPAAYLREVFEGEEAKGWEVRKLGDVLHQRREMVYPNDKPKGKARFVGLEHIKSGTGLRIGHLEVEMAELAGRKPKFNKGDIVYGYLRPYLNKVWIAEFDGLCSVDQYVYTIDPQKANTEFIAWFMRSPTYLERAPISETPGQLPRIRTEEVANVEIHLPPIRLQEQIIEQITKKIGVSTTVLNAVSSQQVSLEMLPASFLRQAFNGEL